MRKWNAKILSALVAACLLLTLAACQNSTGKDLWLENAKLDAHETPEQLYALALQEEPLVVYSESSRIWQVKASFEAQYPGLIVEIHHIRGLELLDMLRKNAEIESYHCDVSICSDDNGVIASEFVPNGILYKYLPWDMQDKVLPQHQKEQLEFVRELFVVFYNTETYDTSPIDNWWQLTDSDYYGKVLLPNPQDSTSTFGFIGAVLQNPDLFYQSHVQFYGYPPPDLQDMNASEYFLYKLVNNGLILTTSGGEVIDRVGEIGQASPPVGITVSSKIRKQDLGLQVGISWDIQPFVGYYSKNSAMIAGGSNSVSSAKLFIRWLLGETDGQGQGYQPYLEEGAWSVRHDVPAKTPAALESYNILSSDNVWIYEHKNEIFEFWNLIIED